MEMNSVRMGLGGGGDVGGGGGGGLGGGGVGVGVGRVWGSYGAAGSREDDGWCHLVCSIRWYLCKVMLKYFGGF